MASYPIIPTYMVDLAIWVRKMADAINEMRVGKINTTNTVTLTANAASTTVTDLRVGKDTKVFLTPATANAAAIVATTYVATATIGDGSFVITHANNANADKTFFYVLLG